MFPTNIKILLAEDSSNVRDLLKSLLSKRGYKDVIDAEDGMVALEKLQDSQMKGNNIHLIIADWYMPNMSGLDLLVHVKSDPLLQSIPFLMITGDQELALVTLAISSGADDFIVKPVTEETLTERLTAIWARTQKKD